MAQSGWLVVAHVSGLLTGAYVCSETGRWSESHCGELECGGSL